MPEQLTDLPKEPVNSSVPERDKVKEVKRLFRRKPLLVEASQGADGNWTILEAGRKVQIAKEEFALLYDLVETNDGEHIIDAGLPDLEPGTMVEKDGKRLVRVTVVNGKGAVAYWFMTKPNGKDCGWRVVADNGLSDLPHYAGRFVEAFEGKPGTRAWVEVR